jgi:rod shape-determining protein MreC
LSPVKRALFSVAGPIHWATSLPGRIGEWSEDTFTRRGELLAEIEALRAQNFVLQQKIQKMAALSAENVHLSELLNASEEVEENVLVAKLSGISPDPLRHEIVINKGDQDGVFVGQAVLDADGLVGMVTEVAARSSRVMLIIDTSNAVPVQVLRNGVRFIAEGRGKIDEMELRHVPATADIVEGDMLVSSGLAKRYPSGYPVGNVVSIIAEPGQPFLTVRVRPIAELNRSRNFLLIFDEDVQTAAGEHVDE